MVALIHSIDASWGVTGINDDDDTNVDDVHNDDDSNNKDADFQEKEE